jgi:hypothetical protein
MQKRGLAGLWLMQPETKLYADASPSKPICARSSLISFESSVKWLPVACISTVVSWSARSGRLLGILRLGSLDRTVVMREWGVAVVGFERRCAARARAMRIITMWNMMEIEGTIWRKGRFVNCIQVKRRRRTHGIDNQNSIV